jgi:enoyl-CoA hydratase/carnithine racemase
MAGRPRSRPGPPRRVARIPLRLRRGRIDEASAQALLGAAEEIRLDESVAVVLLAPTGPDFCIGFAGLPWGARIDCVEAVAGLPQPVVAAVQGRAWAEGCELAMACDLRLVTAATSFRLPQITAGRLPSAGGTQRLPRLVGVARALDILWSGREVRGAEAVAIGLATRLGSGRRAAALAAELARKGPAALRLAKEAVRAAADMTLEQGIRFEHDLYVLLQTTEERAQGIQDFLDRGRRRR